MYQRAATATGLHETSANLRESGATTIARALRVLTPSVPAEFIGMARAFRRSLDAEDILAATTIETICGSVYGRYRRGHHTARLLDLQNALREWREAVPTRGRIALETRLNERAKWLQITELRARPAVVTQSEWSGELEPSVLVVAVGMEARPKRFRATHATLAVVSLHALARRYQRADDKCHGAVLRDLRVLAEKQDALVLLGDGAPFHVPCSDGGVWAGVIRATRLSPENETLVLFVRTYLSAGMLSQSAGIIRSSERRQPNKAAAAPVAPL